MARDYIRPDTLPQNTGHPSPDRTHTLWRNSILVGPQTAGIPTVHNEDEGAFESATFGSDSNFQPAPGTGTDPTGGALDYHRTQRRGGK